MTPVIDPRSGDVEDDASSTKTGRCWLSPAACWPRSACRDCSSFRRLSSFSGISPRAGLAPLVASAWLQVMSQAVRSSVLDIWPILIFLAALLVGLFGGVRLFRLAEQSFWSLNAIVIQPVYVVLREVVAARRGAAGAAGARRDARGCAPLRRQARGSSSASWRCWPCWRHGLAHGSWWRRSMCPRRPK